MHFTFTGVLATAKLDTSVFSDSVLYLLMALNVGSQENEALGSADWAVSIYSSSYPNNSRAKQGKTNISKPTKISGCNVCAVTNSSAYFFYSHFIFCMQSSSPVEMVETMENEHQGACTEPALKPKNLIDLFHLWFFET